jgi:hypothetical protein
MAAINKPGAAVSHAGRYQALGPRGDKTGPTNVHGELLPSNDTPGQSSREVA